MLIGEFPTQIGEKNRVVMPKKLREKLGENLIITRGYERCLILVDQERWESLVKVINSGTLLSISVRDTKRYLLGGAIDIEPDNQGRFVMPENLLEFAGVDKDLIFLGVGEWIEIWSSDRWKSKLNDLSNNVADLAERIGQTI